MYIFLICVSLSSAVAQDLVAAECEGNHCLAHEVSMLQMGRAAVESAIDLESQAQGRNSKVDGKVNDARLSNAEAEAPVEIWKGQLQNYLYGQCIAMETCYDMGYCQPWLGSCAPNVTNTFTNCVESQPTKKLSLQLHSSLGTLEDVIGHQLDYSLGNTNNPDDYSHGHQQPCLYGVWDYQNQNDNPYYSQYDVLIQGCSNDGSSEKAYEKAYDFNFNFFDGSPIYGVHHIHVGGKWWAGGRCLNYDAATQTLNLAECDYDYSKNHAQLWKFTPPTYSQWC